jgi:isoamyl acetate esterase
VFFFVLLFLLNKLKRMWKKLILIGDSNTQFGYGEASWVSIISDRLQRKCDVINRGFSGYSTKHLRNMLPEIMNEFNKENVAGVIIGLGTNDSSKAPQQNVPVDKYGENMNWIIEYLTNFGIDSQNIVLIIPPPIDDQKWIQTKKSFGDQSFHFHSLVMSYVDLCIKIAIEKSLSFVNLHEKMSQPFGKYLHDGLHLSHEGGSLLADSLWEIVSKWSHLKEEKYPNWRNLPLN